MNYEYAAIYASFGDRLCRGVDRPAVTARLITNLAYSFSGHAPKIYWYLSRASGFIALTILWVSMAMGLGLTNKLARRWPGAPAAFAIHEYVSLLGLLFAVYHGLVLMGDHYVDFSLPRLLVPFSIKYEPFWVGLGQVAFYTWVIVLLSFYVRQYIGQKTWRMIHYANFVVYMMGLFHGLFSGTDGTAALGPLVLRAVSSDSNRPCWLSYLHHR